MYDVASTRPASPFDGIRRLTESGREYWSARELMPLLGYDSWRRFEETIERAMIAVKNTGVNQLDHFADTGKKVSLGSGAERTVTDYEMTRFGAYMAAMNGDPRKPEIAAAQSYFAIQTRVAETAPTPVRELTFEEKMAEVMGTLNQRIADQHAALAIAAPKADAFDALLSTVGDYSVNEAAKVLARDHQIQIGEGRLRALLEEWKWVYRQSGKPRAMQTQVDCGRLTEKAQFHYHPETGEKVLDTPQVRVTAKGVAAIRERILKQRGEAAA